jgi:hypothetical protein
MRTTAEANEVIIGTLGLLLSLFTSPFFLEASVAFIGLTLVLAYNQYMVGQESKDEWVLMPKDPLDDAGNAVAPKSEN